VHTICGGIDAKKDCAGSADEAVLGLTNAPNVSGRLRPAASKQNIAWSQPMSRKVFGLCDRDLWKHGVINLTIADCFGWYDLNAYLNIVIGM